MKILLSTGIYPPEIGGPAQYAKNSAEAWRKAGHDVTVSTYGVLKKLPTGIRHLAYFFRVFLPLLSSEIVVVLDTFSVALPVAAAAFILRKKFTIRTGGDFLWESYVERTGDFVLFSKFYETTRQKWTRRERVIFSLTRWTLRRAHRIIFSTAWQRDIFVPAYGLDAKRCALVENFYGPKDLPASTKERAADKKVFVAGTRPLKWKNISALTKAFDEVKKRHPDVELDISNAPYAEFFEKIRHAHAVVLVSIGDISPNMVLDALRASRPVLVTSECGILDRVGGAVLTVKPDSISDITQKLEMLCDPKIYAEYERRSAEFTFVHTWEQITAEILAIAVQK